MSIVGDRKARTKARTMFGIIQKESILPGGDKNQAPLGAGKIVDAVIS